MSNNTTSTTGGGFDPRPFLRKLNGRDYLEVVHRLQWLRAEHPDAIITTKLEHLDWEAGYAVFHARVEIPGRGVAEGTGSETRQGFPSGWLEKSETIAVGRALAMLGFGTAFALADFETAETGNGHLADSPVDTPTSGTTTAPANGTTRTAAPPTNGNSRSAGNGTLSTPAQLKLMSIIATRDLHITEEKMEERCRERYGRPPLHLNRREASEFIDSLKAATLAVTSR